MEKHRSIFYFLDQWWCQHQTEKLSTKLAPSSSKRWVYLPTPGSVIFTLVVIVGILWAQSAGALPLAAPSSASTGTIAYQGRLADTAGLPLTGTYNMTFRLYSAASGGAPLWEETWTGANSVQVSDGLFNVMLGSLAQIPASIIAANSSLFLGITVGTDSEMAPRVQLGSVPFAVQALTVPDGAIGGKQLANSGFGASQKPLLNFVPVSPRVTVLELASVSSTSGWTTLNLSQWLPEGTEAVLIYGGAGDLNSATTGPEIRFDKPGVRQGIFVITPGAPNNHWQLEQGIVPVDNQRSVEYAISASGTNTFRTTILIVGYFERANR